MFDKDKKDSTGSFFIIKLTSRMKYASVGCSAMPLVCDTNSIMYE